MIRCFYAHAAAALAFLAVAGLGTGTCRADFVQVGFTGTVTAVSDPLGIFNNTIGVGSPVSGSYTYTPSGMLAFSTTATGAVYLATGGDRDLRISLGSLTLETFPSPLLRLIVTNDAPGIGDRYQVGVETQFPSAFVLLDDPLLTFPTVTLDLADPTGSALSSLALPLAAPRADAYATRLGSITISDADTGDLLAEARFSIATITAVPEPGSLALLVSGTVSGAAFLLLRRRGGRGARGGEVVVPRSGGAA